MSEAPPRRPQVLEVVGAVPGSAHHHGDAVMTRWGGRGGKDGYVEKPCSHTVHEGRIAVEAAHRYRRIVQHGTQSRSSQEWALAAAAIQSGKLGKLLVSRALCYKPRGTIGVKPTTTPPEQVDFDIWLGPAPKQPYHENLVHYNWHWFWEFGNGDLGNNGIHLIDILRWGMRKKLPVRVHSTGGRFGYKDQGQTPNSQNVTWVYEDGSTIVGQLRGLYTAEPMSWDFFGAKGHMHILADGRFQITMGRNKKPEPEA